MKRNKPWRAIELKGFQPLHFTWQPCCLKMQHWQPWRSETKPMTRPPPPDDDLDRLGGRHPRPHAALARVVPAPRGRQGPRLDVGPLRERIRATVKPDSPAYAGGGRW